MGQGSASEASGDGARGAARPWLRGVLGILPPQVSPPAWHVSPAVDALAYHFSWVLLLVPLLCLGDRHPADYRFLFLLAVAGNFAHQALSLPLVYLDREVARREAGRVLYLPLTLLGLFVVSVVWWRLDVPRHATFGLFILPLAALSFAWNFWHVYMQKYGILRLYDAKAVRSGSPAVPGGVDRLFVLGWLPLTVAVIGPRHREFLLRNFPFVDGPVRLILDGLDRSGPVPVLLGALVAAWSLLRFFLHELRSHGLGCTPRLSAALGMTLLLGLAAGGQSHQGRDRLRFQPRGRVPDLRLGLPAPAPRLAAPRVALARPPDAPAGPLPRTLRAGGLGGHLRGARLDLLRASGDARPGAPGRAALGGVDLLAIFLSMSHFWFDGFLWKMRRADVRGSI